jgi:cytochrome c553
MNTMAYRFAGALAAAGVFIALLAASAPPAGAAPPQSAMCAGCHGALGEGAASGVPRLAGQDSGYMSHALAMFKDGSRVSAIMQPIAQTLDESQMRSLADYFSRQAAPVADTAPVSLELASAGKQLAATGGGQLAACFSCHGPEGKGDGARHPRIAGQPAQFLIARLHQFQGRAREKAPDPGSMTAISAAMTEQQVKEAAAYLSRLEP